jgi:hypothetical protein
MVSRYVAVQYTFAFVLGLGLLGVFWAGFLAWREQFRLIGLRAWIGNVNCFDRAPKGTIVLMIVHVLNSGARTVATDWKLAIGTKLIVRAFDRTFRADGESFDPQKNPIERGAHAYGTLRFALPINKRTAEQSRRKWRVTF